jgi:hypothetical protein
MKNSANTESQVEENLAHTESRATKNSANMESQAMENSANTESWVTENLVNTKNWVMQDMGKANGVSRVASGLPELAWGCLSYLDALLDKRKPKSRWEADEEVFG